MKIDQEGCIVCGECVPYCPMGAISVNDVAVIDQDECVDCGVCLRADICPVDAIVYEPAPWPRSLRAFFSDARAVHKDTNIPGRGTSEMKTNELTGTFKRGWVGIGLEMGRPGVGTRFHDVNKVTQAMAQLGVDFATKNPVTCLMKDVSTGELKEEVLEEKVLSAIVEFTFPIEKFEDVLASMRKVSQEIDTVFSVDCINRCETDGSLPVEEVLRELGVPYYINGKTNVGLGRPLAGGGN